MALVHQRNEKTKRDISLMCATDVRDKKIAIRTSLKDWQYYFRQHKKCMHILLSISRTTKDNCDGPSVADRHTVGQIHQKYKETSNLMWLSLINKGKTGKTCQVFPVPKSEHESTKRKCPMCNGNSSSPQETGRNLQSRNNFDTRRVV